MCIRDRFTSDTALTSGDTRGKFQLQASASAAITDTAEIYVGPQATAISPASVQLNSAGGTAAFTLTGEHLTAGIVLGLFAEGSDTAVATAETALSGSRCSAALAVPQNTSEETDAVYTVKISYDGGASYETTIRGETEGDPAPTATVTVLSLIHIFRNREHAAEKKNQDADQNKRQQTAGGSQFFSHSIPTLSLLLLYLLL